MMFMFSSSEELKALLNLHNRNVSECSADLNVCQSSVNFMNISRGYHNTPLFSALDQLSAV